MKTSSGRKLRRLGTHPGRERKLDREMARRRAAFDIDLRRRVLAALKAQGVTRERLEQLEREHEQGTEEQAG